MGWGVIPPKDHPPYCRDQRMFVEHTGGAVGASSVLLILPRCGDSARGGSDVQGSPLGVVEELRGDGEGTVEGVVVAIMVNMQGVGMQRLALQVARIFETLPCQQ